MDALNRGNNAQASQLWLTMSAADRANFSHGVGFKPQMDRDDVASALLKHEQEEAAKDAQDSITDPDNDSDTASDSGAETESQQIECRVSRVMLLTASRIFPRTSPSTFR